MWRAVLSNMTVVVLGFKSSPWDVSEVHSVHTCFPLVCVSFVPKWICSLGKLDAAAGRKRLMACVHASVRTWWHSCKSAQVQNFLLPFSLTSFSLFFSSKASGMTWLTRLCSFRMSLDCTFPPGKTGFWKNLKNKDFFLKSTHQMHTKCQSSIF
jgi:hypothetical protein